MSKVLTDQIEKRTGGTAIDVPATGKWPQGNIADDAVGTAQLSATGTASATTFLRGDNSWTGVDTSGIDANKEDIALLAFKTQANGNLARYNLIDQSVDAFEDASGISAGDSTADNRDTTGKYYSGSTVPNITGGTITTDGNYTIHTMPTGTTNYVSDRSQVIDYLIIAGGGSGGVSEGGGGGAGGYRYFTGVTLAAGTYAAVVGAGGASVGPGAGSGANGANSSFNGLSSTGGGGGSSYPSNAAGTGGSGGGGSRTQGYATGNAGNYTPVEGYRGGGQATTATGGGGAGGTGQDSFPSGGGGSGGVGVSNSITGAAVFYAGGGGGSFSNATGYANNGGNGGGGTGGGEPSSAGTTEPGAGTNGLGGGGGGARNSGADNVWHNSGKGGDGVVIIRRPSDLSYANMILESNTITAQTAPTKADLVFTYTNGAGTAVLGTNITVEASMDGGSTWTDFGIAAGDVQGTTGGHTIVTKNDVTLTSTSGTSMRWRLKTLVQSVSMQTRIHAVSLGWS